MQCDVGGNAVWKKSMLRRGKAISRFYYYTYLPVPDSNEPTFIAINMFRRDLLSCISKIICIKKNDEQQKKTISNEFQNFTAREDEWSRKKNERRRFVALKYWLVYRQLYCKKDLSWYYCSPSAFFLLFASIQVSSPSASFHFCP